MLKAEKPEETNAIAQRAAKNLRGILAEERWSGRKAAIALGLNSMYVNRRLSGEAELSVSDVEMFARLLKVNSGALYAQLMKAPTLPSEGQELPLMDSNHQPAGIKLAPVRRLSDRMERLRPVQIRRTSETLAHVTQISAAR